MRVNLTNNATPQFRVLSEDQVERIELASLEILERTGAHVLSPEAISLLGESGAAVDGHRVRMPSELVREMLAAVPSR